MSAKKKVVLDNSLFWFQNRGGFEQLAKQGLPETALSTEEWRNFVIHAKHLRDLVGAKSSVNTDALDEAAAKIQSEVIAETASQMAHFHISTGREIPVVDPTSAVLPEANTSNFPEPIVEYNVAIPDLGLKLLPFLVSKKLRDAVTGDLTEDFRTYATKWGRPYALKWLCWEIAVLGVKRFSLLALVSAAALWLRRKAGM